MDIYGPLRIIDENIGYLRIKPKPDSLLRYFSIAVKIFVTEIIRSEEDSLFIPTLCLPNFGINA